MGKEDRCCILGCFNRREKQPHLPYHVFPQNEAMRTSWIAAIGACRQTGHDPYSRNTKICGEHFMKSDYRKTYGGRKCLKIEAVPSIFSLEGGVVSRTPKLVIVPNNVKLTWVKKSHESGRTSHHSETVGGLTLDTKYTELTSGTSLSDITFNLTPADGAQKTLTLSSNSVALTANADDELKCAPERNAYEVNIVRYFREFSKVQAAHAISHEPLDLTVKWNERSHLRALSDHTFSKTETHSNHAPCDKLTFFETLKLKKRT